MDNFEVIICGGNRYGKQQLLLAIEQALLNKGARVAVIGKDKNGKTIFNELNANVTIRDENVSNRL